MKKLLPVLAGIASLAFSATAQKLPNVQKKSLRAPATIKIDGKPDEWDAHFQAYNKNTDIFYTISNDDDKVYLTVNSTDLDIINKIICAGIVFTVNGSGKMKDEGGVAVTYPVIPAKYFPRKPGWEGPPVKLDKPENQDEADFIITANSDLTSKAKDIRISGIEEIQDTLISIYNINGIKAAARFGDNMAFTYELEIPLKYLNLPIKGTQHFAYNIKLKSMEAGYVSPVVDFKGPPELHNIPFLNALHAQRISLRGLKNYDPVSNTSRYQEKLLSCINPTDFSGEYTLAK